MFPLRTPFAVLTAAPAPALDAAHEAEMAARPDTFALVRVIGNDLPPRHAAGQSRANLRFILANEPDFPDCRKLWIVNRILDAAEEARIVAALEEAGQVFRRIPFVLEDYAQIPLDLSLFPPGHLHAREFTEADEAVRQRARAQAYRLRNAYAMHNNGARNAALDWGRETGAKWVLPFDGNGFLTRADWDRLAADIKAQPGKRYLTVGMARLASNEAAMDPMDPAEATEEPQIAFRSDAALRFDEAHPYGRRPKVELLARLGVPGPWFGWTQDPWDLPAGAVEPDAQLVGRAGMIRRLASGRDDLEAHDQSALQGRGVARAEAIVAALRRADIRVMEARGYAPGRPLLYRRDDLPGDGPLADAIRAAAAEALGRGPFSVTDKTELPPGGNPHDYYHPSPYWWPNPDTRDGLPYVQRDGQRRPGTVMYAPESDAFDRTRLQLMFDDTLACALAFAGTGEDRFRDHARRLVETWFLDPTTAMTPHLLYSQVRRGRANDEGSASGVIEFKDVAYLLDAVSLLDDPDLSERLKGWLRPYRDWLLTSRQGTAERRTGNNHGTYFDLQLAAIAAFLGDTDLLLDCYLDSLARLPAQIEDDGAQPHELSRTLTRHYVAFNLQGWLTLRRLYEGAGMPVEVQPEFDRLRAAADWLLSRRDGEWSLPQIEPFDMDRHAPIALMAAAQGLGPEPGGGFEAEDRRIAREKPRLHPHDGIPPFWPLMAGGAATR